MTMDKKKEQRAHKRIELVQAIFIEVTSRNNRSESRNTIIRCESVNVSEGGLKIFVPQPIAPRSKLNIAVPWGDWQDSLELTGRAVWIKPAEEKNGYWVGLQLDDTDLASMEKWCLVVHSLSYTTPVKKSA